MKILKRDSVYKKYTGKTYSEITQLNVLNDLDAITEVSLETLPLLKFLKMLYQLKNIEDRDTDLNAIYTEALDNTRAWITKNGTKYGTATHTLTAISDFDTVITEATLSSGTLNNHPLYQPGAGYQFVIFTVQIGTNMSAGAAQNYVLEFEDEDSTNIFSMNMLGRDTPLITLNKLGATDDKDFQCDIAGGSAAEHLFFVCKCGKTT